MSGPATSESLGLFDLAVIGGGPAGLSAALAARLSGASTMVIDVPRPARPLEVVPGITRSIVQRLGIEPGLLFHGCPRVNGYVTMWTDGVARRRSTMSNAFGDDFAVDGGTLRHRLREAMAFAGARLHVARVTQIIRTEDRHFRVENVDGTMLACRRLVIATGRATFAALKGNAILAMHRPAMNQQVAIFREGSHAPRSSDVERPASPSAELMVESCENGWWYGVRVSDRAMLPVLVTGADQLPVRDCLEEWFETRLRATSLLSRCAESTDYGAGSLRICSARAFARQTPGGDGWALAGDARAAIDPLSGNGVLRAIQDGVRAARFVLSRQGERLRARFSQAHRSDVSGIAAMVSSRTFRVDQRLSAAPPRSAAHGDAVVRDPFSGRPITSNGAQNTG